MRTKPRSNTLLFLLRLRSVLQTGTALMQQEWLEGTLSLLGISLHAKLIVTLLIPKALRLAGEVRRVFCRVIQHTHAGYQLNTKFGLLSGRYQHRELNGVDNDIPDISMLTPTQAKTATKHTLTKIVQLINNRGPIRAQQRNARGKRQRDEIGEEGRENAGGDRDLESAGTGDIIVVQQPQRRRRRIAAPAVNSSPSAAPAARTIAKRGGRSSGGRRVTRSSRGRGVGRR